MQNFITWKKAVKKLSCKLVEEDKDDILIIMLFLWQCDEGNHRFLLQATIIASNTCVIRTHSTPACFKGFLIFTQAAREQGMVTTTKNKNA